MLNTSRKLNPPIRSGSKNTVLCLVDLANYYKYLTSFPIPLLDLFIQKGKEIYLYTNKM